MLEYLPPRISREVTINGYAVPRVEAHESSDGTACHISLDGRFGAVIPAEHAHAVIWLLANAMAIGAGYSCHGENSTSMNKFKTLVRQIEIVETTNDH